VHLSSIILFNLLLVSMFLPYGFIYKISGSAMTKDRFSAVVSIHSSVYISGCVLNGCSIGCASEYTTNCPIIDSIEVNHSEGSVVRNVGY